MSDTGAPPERGDRDTGAIMEIEGAPVELRPQFRMMLHETDCKRFDMGYFSICNCKGPTTLGKVYYYLLTLAKNKSFWDRKELLETIKEIHR